MSFIASIRAREGPAMRLRSLVRTQVAAGHQVDVVATTVQSAEPWEPQKQYVDRMQQDPSLAGANVFVGRGYGRRRPWSRYGYSPACSRCCGSE